MCRSIKPLFNFEPEATDEEIAAASRQFLKKLGGFQKPSKTNEATFESAIQEISAVTSKYLKSLTTTAPPKNREDVAAKARQRFLKRS